MPVGDGRGRPVGLVKTGGRQKGTPNRSTLAAREKLDALGCEPIAGLAKIAEDPNTALAFKLQAYSILMPYAYSRLKVTDESSREHSSPEEQRMSKEQALEIARDLLALLSPASPTSAQEEKPISPTKVEPKPEVAKQDDES